MSDFTRAAPGRGVIPVLRARGSTSPSVVQQQFNRLIERLQRQREELARWRSFKQKYQQRLVDDYEPLIARLREQRIALAHVLDQAMDGEGLNKRERGSVRDILRQLLPMLLEETSDAELERLHDKYAEVSFLEERQEEMEALRALAEGTFGIDVNDYDGPNSPDDLADWIEEQVRLSRADLPPGKKRKKDSKSALRGPMSEPMAEGSSVAVREVFRKLVSELHPDREADPIEQARKTELMQRVNQAYKAADLLGLLELQLGIEQIDAAALAGLADARLRQYMRVFERQSQQMAEELAAILEPFLTAMRGATARQMTPDIVLRSLELDMREIKRTLRGVESDLVRFKDIRLLKQAFKPSSRR